MKIIEIVEEEEEKKTLEIFLWIRSHKFNRILDETMRQLMCKDDDVQSKDSSISRIKEYIQSHSRDRSSIKLQ